MAKIESDDTFESDVLKPELGFFLCDKTSRRTEDGKPCEESFEVNLYNVIYQEDKMFAVRLDSLQELMDFVAKHGECVIGKTADGWGYIEIYDDFRG